MTSEEQLSTELQKKRRYQCTTCNKAFSRPSALRTHMYTHTGEKPFECTTPGCGRRFAVISNLRRHFKVHRKVVHTNKIPASERLRHVQRLIERTATSSAPPHHSYHPIHYHSPAVLSDQRHHYQYHQQHFNNNYHQQNQANNSKSPLSSLTSTTLSLEKYQQQQQHQRYFPSYPYQQQNDTYALPLTSTPGNNSYTMLTTSLNSSTPCLKPQPKVPFVIMSDPTQQQQQQQHHYYREPVFNWNCHTRQPSSSIGRA